MTVYHIRVIEGGKVVIPAALRRKHGFAVGQTLVVDDSPGGVILRSLHHAVAAAQAIMAQVAPADRVLSDELIAERRTDSERA